MHIAHFVCVAQSKYYSTFICHSSISAFLQAAAFTIGQSMGVPAPSYNLGAAGAPAAPGRVKTVICKKYDKPEGEDLDFTFLQSLKFLRVRLPIWGEVHICAWST